MVGPPTVGVKVKEGWLYIQPLASNIVHVVVSPSDSVPRPRLPVVIPKSRTVAVQFGKGPGYQSIDLANLKVRISQTGLVSFFDAKGNPLSAEAPGSRSLTRFSIPGMPDVPAYHCATSFKYGQDEFLYGLGQHQDGALDRKGTRTLLSQSNREVAIPWLTSTKGYGILWNNASRTEANAAGAADLSELVDEDGHAGGLTGRYYDGENFEKLVGVRRDKGIDFNWTETPPQGLGKEHYSVRWTGSFVARGAGVYRFSAMADDGVRMFIDGQKVLDDWSVHEARSSEASLRFEQGSRHTLKLEFFQGTRDSIVNLTWTRPGSGAFEWKSYAADAIDYYFVAGSPSQLLSSYRDLTGQVPMPPKWALGYWQSKERYNTQAEWQEIAEGYRSRHLPIDNLVQDWFYWDPHAWGSHEFDSKRYPDPKAGIAELHEKEHMHFMISVWGKFAPGSATDPSRNFEELSKKGELYPEAVSSPERFYDAFSQVARADYWGQMHRELLDLGVDAWWLDASEPEANLDELNKTSTGSGPGAFVVSGWPFMHTKGVYEGQRAATSAKRVFILTRSGYAGQQRNGAAVWSGDITASWDTLAKQIPAGLNIAVSGIPYWTTDIGAFFVNYPGGADNPEYRELYTRWFEFGAFCPLFRSHGTNTPREMWRFGPEVQEILAKYDRLRYRLMPYIYSQAWGTTENRGSLMTPLGYSFPADPLACEVSDQFLFGPSLMVCPVIEGRASSRRVYLPKGSDWVDFWTGEGFAGGQSITASAPLDREPIYVRAGSILPFGPDLQYVDEHPADPIELRIYPGASGRFTLYEDEGDGYGYESGRHAEIPMAWRPDQGVLSIGARVGTFPGMLKSRTFKVEVVGDRGPGPAVSVKYSGTAMTVRARG